MRPGVEGALHTFLRHHEGELNYMYLDNHAPVRLVTTAIGCVIEPASAATRPFLVWGHRASPTVPVPAAQVHAEWQRVKTMQDHARGVNGRAFQSVTSLRLTQASMDELFGKTVIEFEHEIRHDPFFADFQNFPADAQMGVMVMAWAYGPRRGGLGRRAPQFSRRCASRDWANAGREAEWHQMGTARREALLRMFLNAANVDRDPAREGILYYPNAAPRRSPELASIT